ncbi:MAG: RtcB family protein [Thermodesulfobacteriota bacterium]|nr:RtcB family protein [Thermodesulfobacteriota bacterium]
METELKKIDDWRWEIPKSGNMRVPGLIFSSPELLDQGKNDQSVIQVANVATLPGIVRHSLAMPDIHWGYGFPIGGVAAFDMEEGIVSPGGVGYDINCGVRLVTTSLPAREIRPRIKEIVSALFMNIPTGVGSRGKIKLSKSEEKRVAAEGASWAIKNGLGVEEDLETTEDNGVMRGADPEAVSDRAYKRGHDEVGTLGSGNHFLEIQYVDEIYDQKIASAFNLFKGQLTVMIHTGSRGFGHQICDDFLKEMNSHVQDAGFVLPDRQLACAYIKSETGKRYLSAMACAANYAWVNRQVIMHWTRETFESVLGISPRDLKMELLYDVCHNIAKIESHMVDGKKTKVCVHRKGATRSLSPNHPDVPQKYRESGQPVIIPGDMGTYSYVLTGSQKAMDETFGSTCHGAGRVLSRRQAVKLAKGRAIAREMEDRGIFVQSRGRNTLKEEIPEAYKDVSLVVEAVHMAGLAKKVARMRPIGVIKG